MSVRTSAMPSIVPWTHDIISHSFPTDFKENTDHPNESGQLLKVRDPDTARPPDPGLPVPDTGQAPAPRPRACIHGPWHVLSAPARTPVLARAPTLAWMWLWCRYSGTRATSTRPRLAQWPGIRATGPQG